MSLPCRGLTVFGLEVKIAEVGHQHRCTFSNGVQKVKMPAEDLEELDVAVAKVVDGLPAVPNPTRYSTTAKVSMLMQLDCNMQTAHFSTLALKTGVWLQNAGQLAMAVLSTPKTNTLASGGHGYCGHGSWAGCLSLFPSRKLVFSHQWTC